MNENPNTTTLDEIRSLIDSVDREILMLLKQRSRIVDLVVAYKKENGMKPHQPERFAQMMEELHKVAKKEKLDAELVTEVWDAIHKSSQRQQTEKLR